MMITKQEITTLKQFLKTYRQHQKNNQNISNYLYLKIQVQKLLKYGYLTIYNNISLCFDELIKLEPRICAIIAKYSTNHVFINYLDHICNAHKLVNELYFVPSFVDSYILNCTTYANDVEFAFGLSLSKKAHNNRLIYKLKPNYRYRHAHNLAISFIFSNVELITGVLHNDYIGLLVDKDNHLAKFPIKEHDNRLYVTFFTNKGAPLSISCDKITFINNAKSVISSTSV